MSFIKILVIPLAAAVVLGGVTPGQSAEPDQMMLVSAAPRVTKKPAPTFAATIKQGRKTVRAELKKAKATSVSVTLVANRAKVWSQTFGRVNTAGKKPSSTTEYPFGSVSKVVTAIAVMQLVDAGKVSLNAPVVRYVPDFTMKSPQYRQITVRMLLNHSAGLPGMNYADAVSYQPIPSYLDSFLPGLANSALKTTPGAMNSYCNDCFTLAGLVVERVSGMPFQDYVTANILDPLRMRHSSYPTTMPKPGTVAPVIQGDKVEPLEIFNTYAAGGILSTPNDMAKMARIFTGDGVVRGKRILSSSAVQRMSKDQTTTTLKVSPPGEFRFGLGWDTVKDPALKTVGVRGWTKGGDTIQHHSAFTVAPDQGLAVTVAGAGMSFSSGSAETIGRTVLLRALVDMGVVKKMPPPISGKPARAKATRQQVRDVTGIYLAQSASWKVTPGKNRSLKWAALSDGRWVNQPGRYLRRADGAFWSTKVPGQSVRSVKAWDRTYLVVRSIAGTGTFYSSLPYGERTRSQGSLSPAWQARVGRSWLLANEDPSSIAWGIPPTVKLAAIPGLSGYLKAENQFEEIAPFDAGTGDTVGTMFLQIPGVLGRDMNDFEFSPRQGEEFLSFASSVLRPADSVPHLSNGPNPVKIGSAGLIEWYKAPKAAQLTISGQSDWKLYDDKLSMLASGGGATATQQAPAGAYLAIFGPAGSTAHVTEGVSDAAQ
jgi:CubicO group peptidase (beta-lactamase class C family)